MDITEIFQKYFYIIIAVVFFLYRMFSGSKTAKGNTMPTFGGGTKQENHDQDDRDYVEQDDDYQSQYEDQNSQEQRRRVELQRLQEEQIRNERQMQRADQLHEEQKMRYEQQQRAQQAATTHQKRRDNLSADYFAQNELGSESKAQQPVDPFATRENSPHKSSLTTAELRKAVLWSEVLSSPRAKRPFRR